MLFGTALVVRGKNSFTEELETLAYGCNTLHLNTAGFTLCITTFVTKRNEHYDERHSLSDV